ncbi:MAG: aminopeptidase P family protein [Planctomycetota bacterium]|nr:MAG: aminopeptidase P family protein [Planctomycetota bacterium]
MLASTILSTFLLAALPQQLPEDGRGQGLFPATWHAGRRQALMEDPRVQNGIIVLRGAGTTNDYREFRQDNNFWYFTGITTPNAVLVLVPKTGEEYLFVPPVQASAEVWVGNLIDPEEAKAITGIEKCLPLGARSRGFGSGRQDVSALSDLLDQLSRKHKRFLIQGQPAENWMMSRDQLQNAVRSQSGDPYDGRASREAQFRARLDEHHKVKEVKDITVLLDAMRVRKTAQEAQAMRRACQISGQAHQAVITWAKPGHFEWQIAARMTGTMLEAGAMGPAYAPIVGSGPNANILHYNENHRAIQEGDVVLIDYGAEFQHYVADITRSWPVSSRFTDRQREVYQAVFDAQEAAFAATKPGVLLSQVEAAAMKVLAERGFGRDCWHGISHWLGMATHDVGLRRAKLEPGMVFTVEPGVYLPEEGFGIRIEDVVMVTESGHEILSAGIPRTVSEIEAMRAKALGQSEKQAETN